MIHIGVFRVFGLMAILMFSNSAWTQASIVGNKSDETKVYFVSPKNKTTLHSPFKVVFGLDGMRIGPLGDLNPRLGHHHLIIDSDFVKTGETVPFDEKHLHFGKGQTETELDLPPGKYKLTLQFGNGAHQSYGEKMSSSVHIEVKK
jgi:hypothetical protein